MFKWRPLRLIRVLICCPVTKQEREKTGSVPHQCCCCSACHRCSGAAPPRPHTLLRAAQRHSILQHGMPSVAAPLRCQLFVSLPQAPSPLAATPASPRGTGGEEHPSPPNEEGREGRRRWEERHEILGEESEGKRRQKERDKWIKKCRKKNHQLVDAAAIRCLR